MRSAARAEETAAAVQTYYLGLKKQPLHTDTPTPAKTKTAAPKPKTGFTVLELAKLYNFPDDADGSGQCIGIIELGGGYAESDLKKYFGGLGLSVPKVTPVSVDGVKNNPTQGDYGLDAVVTMNIEVAGAVAPGAHIVVYFAPNTDHGFLDAISAAVADEENAPSVLVICWGSPENNWTTDAVTAMDQAFQAAAKKQITVVCSAGDNGVTGGVDDGHPHLIFPASSPWVLACGGTHLIASGGKVKSEVAWNDNNGGATGGGVSEIFPLPDWQSEVAVPTTEDGHRGRGIPDLAANASPSTGYLVSVHGREMVVGGTSASAPFLAGLIALMNQSLGRKLGYINPLLYKKIGPAGVIHAITEGDNGVQGVKGYRAGPGWNACTGWGRPDGRKLIEALRAHSDVS